MDKGILKGTYLFGDDNLEQIYVIRKQVFEVEQNIDKKDIYNDLDKESIHCLVFLDEKPVGAGRITLLDDEYRLGKIAVLKEFRGMYIGQFIVQLLIDKVLDMGKNIITIHAQLQAKSFYEKLGFEVSGDFFQEVNIPHIKMIYSDTNHCCK